MLYVENQTPFQTTIAMFPDREGIDTLYVIVKGTVTLRPKLTLADAQVPIILADAYHGDPATSSLRVSSEMHLGKTGTDVLLAGSAWALDGRPIPRTLVSMLVANRQKTIQVTGDRTWRDGKPSSPRPFESMPLVWERAFGGVHQRGEQMAGDGRNPVGCGSAAGRSAGDMQGQAVPNLEDPGALLQQLGQTPEPVCFAPIAPSWLPRRMYAGTYDERWKRERAPYLPDDFDPRYFQCAAPGFAFDRYFQPGESVQISGVRPDGPLAFTLPDPKLAVEVTVAGSRQRPPANLETLSIEPDENRACFTWRAALRCNRQALRVQKIVVGRSSTGSPS